MKKIRLTPRWEDDKSRLWTNSNATSGFTTLSTYSWSLNTSCYVSSITFLRRKNFNWSKSVRNSNEQFKCELSICWGQSNFNSISNHNFLFQS
jgi:hypothetical protein